MQSITLLRIPDDIKSDYLNLFLANVSEERRQKFTRFVKKDDAYRSLLGEVLIRSKLSVDIGLNHGEFHFSYNQYGKPSLCNNLKVSFNISHSGNWVAMLWSNNDHCLGIDVEKIVPIDFQFATTLFSPQENKLLASKSGDDQLDYFYQLWTLKESYTKALGKGLSFPLDSFSMVHSDKEKWFSPEAIGFQFKSFRIDRTHILSVCSNTDTLPDRIQYVSLSELYESLL
ncbi:4'-phosphopantetheinyl transferase family protein [Sporosarcina sp. FSL K6-3457]|uniref:4'-phosphopantetheinyl transferase family protein n=1 Tax=Sporosarcina sp. FSL K6-3457 TaxID=2978204 RepID=UPI0030F8AC8C